jgi:hypothetical protein|tara:strand:+ start:1350 stop:1679 length:330 start_codon:yes stop_codon:yes gene_type:complete
VSAGSVRFGEDFLLAAVELTSNDVPWELPVEVEKINALVKYSSHLGDADARVILTFYDNTWNATDQLSDRLVSLGQLDRFGGGECQRWLRVRALGIQVGDSESVQFRGR